MKVVTAILALAAAFLFGVEYERTLLKAKLETQKLIAARQRFFDWRRFTDHIREDRKAFGRKSLLFPSNIVLTTLTPIRTGAKSPLIVLQSPIDYHVFEQGFSLLKVVRSSDRGDSVRLVKVGEQSREYRLRMTLRNTGSLKDAVGMEGISMKDDRGKTHYPTLRRESVYGMLIRPGQETTYELLFDLDESRLPESIIISDSTGAMSVPSATWVYAKR